MCIPIRCGPFRVDDAAKRPGRNHNSGTYLGWSAGVVQTQLLDAEEVFAVRNALWDVGRVGVCRGLSFSICFHNDEEVGKLRMRMTYSSASSSIRTGLLSSANIGASFSSFQLVNPPGQLIHIGSSQLKTKERERGGGGGRK
jgi:hypothetical protein